MEEEQLEAEWPGFPEHCRSRHPWLPGTVAVTWEPCRCPAAQAARGGHIEVTCGTPGCMEVWQKPRHEPFRLPRILGHHRPGHLPAGYATRVSDYYLARPLAVR